MRSMYGPGTLLLASKKPRIKELIAKIQFMSLDEIKLLNEKPDIIRGLLHIKELGTEKLTVAEMIAYKMQENFKPSQQILNMKIYQYVGDILPIKVGKSEVYIENNWYWGKTESNKIYFSNINTIISDEILKQLLSSSIEIIYGTFDDLKKLNDERIKKLL